MNKSCIRLINHLDFKCFSKSNTDVKTYNCDISYAKWDVLDEGTDKPASLLFLESNIF